MKSESREKSEKKKWQKEEREKWERKREREGSYRDFVSPWGRETFIIWLRFTKVESHRNKNLEE